MKPDYFDLAARVARFVLAMTALYLVCAPAWSQAPVANLAMICGDATKDGAAREVGCSPMRFDYPSATDLVVHCTDPARCTTRPWWGTGTVKYVRFGTLPATALLEVCTVAKTPGETATSCGVNWDALPMLAKAALSPSQLFTWRLKWEPVTTNTDGTPATVTGYVVQSSTDNESWTEVVRTSGDVQSVSIALSSGTRSFRALTLTAAGTSAPSSSVTATRPLGSAPEGVEVVGAPSIGLSLVSGASTGQRAVYEPTSTRSRGAKLGNLAVGPTKQTSPPFNRVQCDANDTIKSGATTYYRITDPRQSELLRSGYVTGCVNYGDQP